MGYRTTEGVVDTLALNIFRNSGIVEGELSEKIPPNFIS
jgi:hypothetical protein